MTRNIQEYGAESNVGCRVRGIYIDYQEFRRRDNVNHLFPNPVCSAPRQKTTASILAMVWVIRAFQGSQKRSMALAKSVSRLDRLRHCFAQLLVVAGGQIDSLQRTADNRVCVCLNGQHFLDAVHDYEAEIQG